MDDQKTTQRSKLISGNREYFEKELNRYLDSGFTITSNLVVASMEEYTTTKITVCIYSIIVTKYV